MKHLLHGLERHGLGRRAMTERDFWGFCEQDDVEVFLSKKRFPMYFTVPRDDLRVIVLPDRLTGLRFLFTAFHELAHHWKDGGDEPCVAFLGGSDKKCEAEADAIAVLALLPKLDTFIDDPDKGFAAYLYSSRIKLLEYGI